jgi:hypothetical protein
MATRIKLPTLHDLTTAKLAQATAMQDRSVRVQAALNRGRVTAAQLVISKANQALTLPPRYSEVERARQAMRVALAKRRANTALA